MAGLGFNARVDVLVSVAWARWQDEGPNDSLKRTAKQLREVAQLRNRYVHSIFWGNAAFDPPHDASQLAFVIGSQRAREASIPIMGLVSRDILDKAIEQVEAATTDLIAMHAELEDWARASGDLVDIPPGWGHPRR